MGNPRCAWKKQGNSLSIDIWKERRLGTHPRLLTACPIWQYISIVLDHCDGDRLLQHWVMNAQSWAWPQKLPWKCLVCMVACDGGIDAHYLRSQRYSQTLVKYIFSVSKAYVMDNLCNKPFIEQLKYCKNTWLPLWHVFSYNSTF